MPVSEELAVERIGGVEVDRLGVGVVGQVEARNGEAHGVLRVDADVLPNPRVEREEVRKASRVGDADVALQRVDDGVGESVAILHHRRETEAARQVEVAPGEEAIGQIGGRGGHLVGVNDGVRKAADVAAKSFKSPVARLRT